MRLAGRPSKLPQTVCFRLPPAQQQQLCRQATEDGISHGQLARRILVDYLEDSVRGRLEGELMALQEEVALLRGDLATLAEALLVLVSHGGGMTPMEARAWVEDRLRQVTTSG
jgi:hypothetical protein